MLQAEIAAFPGPDRPEANLAVDDAHAGGAAEGGRDGRVKDPPLQPEPGRRARPICPAILQRMRLRRVAKPLRAALAS